MEEKRSEKWMFAAACFAGSAAYILMKLEVGVVPEGGGLTRGGN